IRSVSLLNGGLFPETHKPTVVQKLLASKAGNFVEKLIFRPIFKMGLKQVLGEQSKGNSQFLNDATEQVFRHGGVGLAHEQLGYIEERRQNRGRWVEALQNASNPPPGGKIPPVRLQLIDGLADTISGAHMVDNFKKWVPAATVVGIAGVGHYPQVEAPAQVVSEMKRFLNR
ncbi:MAG: alpha/beta hydrolase, partial [Myxococcaceae bacterium]|nr:alpha/beta hydrolase [Myxococcaceae bacterium]